MTSCICKNLHEVNLKQHAQMQSSHLGKLLKGISHFNNVAILSFIKIICY